MYSSFEKRFEHLRIPLVDIKLATNNFSCENVIGKGGFGYVYGGQLLQSGQLMNIAVKRLDPSLGRGIKEFWTEISMLSRLKHENLVSIVGYCDEDGENIIINKKEEKRSVTGYLNDPVNLTWLRRLHICVGAARALSYIHHDVIHRNIKSSKLLLDKNWEAKVCSFGLSVHNEMRRPVFDAPVGEISYIDPLYMRTGCVTHKSDVYSFGVTLFEVLSGRNPSIRDPNTRQYLVATANQLYEEGKLDEIIDPYLRNQMHPQSLAIFSEIAYHCLKEQRTQRPEMEMVAKRLEKAWELQRRHENPEQSETGDDGASSSYLREGNLEHLRIRLDDIEFATENFHETYYIGSGGYGKVYKAELYYFDGESPLIEEKNIKDGFPKRHGTVAIKRMFSREDEQGEQSFFSEIELLTRCKHPNVIPLLGFCDEGRERILVYEHAFNGSLDDYFGNPSNMTIFSWIQRLKISLDIANGLHYLHNTIEGKQMIIHRDIKSANVLLGKNWEAKIADFGLSRIQHENQQGSTINTNHIAGTQVYLDPEYLETGMLKKGSDIYSFGVVLFEILSGKVAYDESYYVGNDKGLPSIVRRFFNKGILNEILDPRVKEETDLNSFTLKRGPNQESLDGFLKLAYQCLAENQTNRPTMEVVIIELKKALNSQESNKDDHKISLEDIKLATRNFSDENLIGGGAISKVYRGEVTHANGRSNIAAKRFDRVFGQGEPQFYKELEILLEYKHENVIGLVGYCGEAGEKVIAYEYASNNSLDLHLQRDHLSWKKRLEICIDVASVLEFFHGGVVTQQVLIHRDIKSSNILLTEDWKAKITGFGISQIRPINQDMDYVMENAMGTPEYCDPLYMNTGFLTKESDIYSFGVVLLEILSGKLIYTQIDGRFQNLTPVLKRHYEEGSFDEMVFEDIMEQIVPNSLATFLKIASQCLDGNREERPTAREVVVQLKKALDFQVDHEIWEPKLPQDYKEIIRMSNSPELYSSEKKEDLYNMFSNGILLQQGKVVLSFDGHGERNEMISAAIAYFNCPPLQLRPLKESRFHKVAEMLDLSYLNIRICAKTQFLSPNVVYGVHLVFKFCDSRDFPSKPMFVNLKYRMEDYGMGEYGMWRYGVKKETSDAYFATRRDNEWMMVELYRFMNRKDNEVFKFVIESLSPYYCRDDAIYVEGIEFRAIKKVEHEEIEKLKEVHQVLNSNLNVDQVQQILPTESEKFSLRQVNEKKHLMLSARAALNTSTMMRYKSTPSTNSRFQEVVEFLSPQLFRMNCKIESQLLSPDTEYACYLVFKLSKVYQGLQCPVEVHNRRDQQEEAEFIYLVFPNPWNVLDITRIPERRKDGWMEVIVWKFNSNQELKDDYIPMDLTLRSYKGTLCGLIVCGIEFRPM